MLRKTGVAEAAACALATPSASAAPISALLYYGQLNQLSDNSGEYWKDLNGSGALDVGDTLRGTFDIQTIEDLTGGGGKRDVGPGSGNSGLEGIFEIEVTSVANIRPGPGGLPVADFRFGPHVAFINELGLPAGAMAAVYEDPTPDYNRTAGIVAAEALVLDGSPLAWAFGFGGDADDQWVANGAPTNPLALTNVPAGTAVGAFQYGLSTLLWGFPGTYGQVACPATGAPGSDGQCDVNGSGSVLGTRGIYRAGRYEAYDNVDLTVRPIIPIPAAVWLLGAGFLGYVGLGYRRRREPVG
jgi:hypothetical protein